ncbi:zinc finger CCCH domain-containing protein 67-like [Silene latifolia]|uniref:zinc finger CCCH domain-containing protein 67-like n=1 Tax=Silene latifolia TaxID=37657 RepID=UPI003D77CD39
MPDNLQNHSNSDVDNIKEGISKMKITKEEFDESIEYPYRPGEPDCLFYLKNGGCGYGARCHFNHPPRFSQSDQLPQREGKPDCGFFMKTGSCNFGSYCKYNHPPWRRRAEEVPLNSLGLPLRKEEQACAFYMKNRKCKFGAACKFNHPEPTSVETALPAVSVPAVSGATTAVGTGAYLASPVMPYAGSLPALPWTSSSYFPGQPSYMPYFIPAVQGAVATPHWNGYLGNSSAIGMNLVYTSKNPGEMVTGGQADWSIMANLPQRTDQPEVCRFFMSNEGCKYGSKCKFYHPKEKIAYSLGPHGFPLRPGENICAHFSSYGICRNGPTCKYNHPVAGYISGYYLGMPFVQGLNQPYFASRRNMTICNSTETSRSTSVKITDWIQKPETRHGCGPKHVEDSPEDDQPNAATAEIPQDQSD